LYQLWFFFEELPVTVVHCIGKAFGIFVAHLLWIVAYIARFVLRTVVLFFFPSLCFFFFFFHIEFRAAAKISALH
jgi:hypothetical protein